MKKRTDINLKSSKVAAISPLVYYTEVWINNKTTCKIHVEVTAFIRVTIGLD
jgi:hypothetical protein